MTATFAQFDHTADVGLRVGADTLTELFATAALGMFSLIAEIDSVVPDRWQEVNLEGEESIDCLLIDWLRELLYIHEVEDRLFTDFQILSLSNEGLRACVQSGPLVESVEVLRQVKAITYHALEVKQTPEGWYAQVLFDT
jgi:SHS2 domain-containing protein